MRRGRDNMTRMAAVAHSTGANNAPDLTTRRSVPRPKSAPPRPEEWERPLARRGRSVGGLEGRSVGRLKVNI